jgi:hypothetical protein
LQQIDRIDRERGGGVVCRQDKRADVTVVTGRVAGDQDRASRHAGVVGANAQLISDNSLMVFTSGSSTLAFGASRAKITAQAAEFKSVQIGLGAVTGNPAGLVLDQTSLDGLAGVKSIELVGEGTINLYGGLTLGQLAGNGQPILGSLVLDSAGRWAQRDREPRPSPPNKWSCRTASAALSTSPLRLRR